MSMSRVNFLKWSSLASLVLPLMAYVLCWEAFTQQWFSRGTWHDVVLVRHYAFLVGAIIGASILLGDVGFKQWRLFWLPLVSLAFTYILYVETFKFTLYFGA
jgi:hypothetical protein